MQNTHWSCWASGSEVGQAQKKAAHRPLWSEATLRVWETAGGVATPEWGMGGLPQKMWENYKQFGEFWCISALQKATFFITIFMYKCNS